jgi:hypothetical protein
LTGRHLPVGTIIDSRKNYNTTETGASVKVFLRGAARIEISGRATGAPEGKFHEIRGRASPSIPDFAVRLALRYGATRRFVRVTITRKTG